MNYIPKKFNKFKLVFFHFYVILSLLTTTDINYYLNFFSNYVYVEKLFQLNILIKKKR